VLGHEAVLTENLTGLLQDLKRQQSSAVKHWWGLAHRLRPERHEVVHGLVRRGEKVPWRSTRSNRREHC
jgi:hypothetical protein